MFNYKILIINLFKKNQPLSLGFDFFFLNFDLAKVAFLSLGKINHTCFYTLEKNHFFQIFH